MRKMTPEDWDRVIQVNLSGAFYLSRAILQHMLDRGYGRIINISSVIGEAGNIGQANYAAVQVRPVRADDEPGPGDRPQGHHRQLGRAWLHLHRHGRRPCRRRRWTRSIAKIPVGRLGEPDEVARVVEFLADPDSAFITGQIYSVNGGQYM